MGRARELANLFSGGSADINVKTSDGGILNLQTSDTTVVANDVIGAINFQAPDEGSGTDSILLASKIEAVAESTFSASNNSTSVVISTASSEAAGTAGGKFTFGSTGNLTIKDLRTADGSSPRIALETGDTDIAQDDVLGDITFQAPDEGTGTDAILSAAAIAAVAEGDFSSSSNATKLVFKTASSEAASEKMSLSSAGLLTVADDIVIGDGKTIGSSSDPDAIAIGSDGDVTLTQDLELQHDGAILSFGADDEIQLIHVADDGLILKHIGTGDGKEPSLTFQAGDNDIAQDDVLGSIFFQAPDEGAGTDAVLVAAGIEAVSEGDFSASSNATKLSFKTGASEAATSKMTLSSGGNLSLLTDGAAMNFGANGEITLTHIHDKGLIISSGSSGATADVNADELVVQAGGRGGISIITPDANDSQLAFGSPTDGLGAFVSYKQSTAAMTIGTSLANGIILFTTADGSEKAKFISTGFFKVRGSATSYDGGTSNYHEFLTDESSTTGFVVQSTNSTYTGRLSQFDLPPSDSTSNAKFISCYSSNPGGSADLEFYVRVDGQVYADGNFNAGGADYAEFFEWKDGNTSDENRVGCSVVLDGNQIRKATSSDNTSNIIGVISVNPSVVGDADGDYWQGTYLKDDFGKYIFKDSEQVEWTDKEDVKYSYQKDHIPSDVTVPSDATKTPIKVRTLNPDYDKSKTYERREDRKEWSCVGMMGKLRMLKGQPTGDRWIKMKDISDTVEEWLVR